MGRPSKNVGRISISLPIEYIDILTQLAKLLEKDRSYVIKTFLAPHIDMTRDLLGLYDAGDLRLLEFYNLVTGKSSTESEEDFPKG